MGDNGWKIAPGRRPAECHPCTRPPRHPSPLGGQGAPAPDPSQEQRSGRAKRPHSRGPLGCGLVPPMARSLRRRRCTRRPSSPLAPPSPALHRPALPPAPGRREEVGPLTWCSCHPSCLHPSPSLCDATHWASSSSWAGGHLCAPSPRAPSDPLPITHHGLLALSVPTHSPPGPERRAHTALGGGCPQLWPCGWQLARHPHSSQ